VVETPAGQADRHPDQQADTRADPHAWERPGAFEVLPGVFRIPLPLPGDHLKAVNVYAIADGDQAVLIDAGWALAQAQDVLAAGLGSIGFGLRDVREFLVTHAHRDHYTQAVAIRRELGTRISLGEGERATLAAVRAFAADEDFVHPDAARLQLAGASDLARQIADWKPRSEVDIWADPDRWLTDAVELPLQTRTLRVIATPGHTRGHVVFHDPLHDALFAGDHVLPHITPSIGVEMDRPPSPLRDYLGSLALIRALPDARLLPAHGPVTGSVHERIDELLAHHEERLDATAAVVDDGAATAFECANALSWTRRGRSFAELDLFNQILAVQETMAHLVVLVERGWLREDRVEGTDGTVAVFARA
jgi:glyoxylase-like metal-dependent hydrolase (beta-lactamase superfamily II)